jgi:ADP-ribose pyrophosphatase YjhB (NUDIX family)
MHSKSNIADKLWLSDAEWRTAQKSIPIVCVDILPIRISEEGTKQAGLIYRDTPHQGRRWCLVGGRLLLNESCRTAILRQMRGTLGPHVEAVLDEPVQATYVAEYFSDENAGPLFDPRQHVIALTFVVSVRGAIVAMGEAFDFKWFDVNGLPDESDFGFGQARVVASCLQRVEFGKLV